VSYDRVFTDESGAELHVFSSADMPGFAAIRTSDVVRLPPAGLAPVVAALYAAQGRPEPVILDRPDVSGLDLASAHGFDIGRTKDGVLAFAGARWALTDARDIAATIAAMADAVISEPDPAEVEELATLLHDTRERGTKGSPGEWDRTAARAALKWFAGKQQRGDES
jgi:hypothetical protein